MVLYTCIYPSSGVARKWGEGETAWMFSSPPLPKISFGFQDCFYRFTWVLACFWRNRWNFNTCFSLVILEIFTVKLAAAAECTEFPKLYGARALMSQTQRRHCTPWSKQVLSLSPDYNRTLLLPKQCCSLSNSQLGYRATTIKTLLRTQT